MANTELQRRLHQIYGKDGDGDSDGDSNPVTPRRIEDQIRSNRERYQNPNNFSLHEGQYPPTEADIKEKETGANKSPLDRLDERDSLGLKGNSYPRHRR